MSRNPFRRRRGGRRRGLPALLVAAITILIPLVVIYYAFEHRLPFIGSQYVDYAIVPNSVNVRSGSPVRIAGIDVGAVTSVQGTGDATKIGFTLDSSARPIHTDATLTVRDRLFLEGGYYLALSPGSPSAPIASEGFTIRDASTATPVQFFQVLSTFDAAARANLAQLLNTANAAFSPATGAAESDSGAGAFKQALPVLSPLLKNIAIDSQALRGTEPNDLGTLLRGSSAITSTLAARQAQLVGLVDGLDTTASALVQADGSLGRSISGVDQTLVAAPPALSAVNGSLAPVRELAAALTPSLLRSPGLVSALDTEVRRVDGVVDAANRPALLKSLDALFVQLPGTLTSLAGTLPVTTPVTECLGQRIVPLLKEDVQDGALSTNEPVWKDLVHMLPGLSGASGDFDADGPYLRALIGIGNQSLPTTALGSLPGVGGLVSTLLGGTSSGSGTSDSLEGSSPTWVGSLTPADFRPDVSCTTQPLPTNLSSNPADADQAQRRAR